MHFPSPLPRHLACITLALAALLLCAAEAQAQWKWRDSRGQIHLSDIPPPRDIPDKDVLQRPDLSSRKAAAQAAPAASAPAVAAAAVAKPPVDPELEERRKRAEQEKAARTKADEQKLAAARKDNCQRAREQLATMESGQRIARIKADGEREILDDDQRAREARRARDLIAADCR
jgi:hypothetical protein